uniref:Polyprenyl synthetase n=1 Tax=Ammonifex degensii TaxID=42838 RepID=A0A7C1F831_9THEO
MVKLQSLLPLRSELAAVQSAVEETVAKSGSKLSLHFVKEAREDELRPALVFLSGRLCEVPPGKLLPLAAAVQLIFLAGVLHRKASETGAAGDLLKDLILLGDYLYSASFRVLADAALQRLLIPLARVVQAECSVIDSSAGYGGSDPAVIKNEVALLIGECCRLPATMADVSFGEALYDFGVNLGMLYGLLRRGASPSLAEPFAGGAKAALTRLPARPARHYLKEVLQLVTGAFFGAEVAATR